jgi:hypothetical protein
MFKNWPMWWKVLAAIGGIIVGIAGIVSAYYTVRAYYYPPNPQTQNNAKANTENKGTNLTNNDPVKRNSNNSIHYQKPSMEITQRADKKSGPPSQKTYSSQPLVQPVKIELPSIPKSSEIKKTENVPVQNAQPIIYPKVIINISGSKNIIYVKQSSSDVAFGGSDISGSKTSKTLYAPKGQRIHIIINGSKNHIKVAEPLLEFVSSEDSGLYNILEPLK